MELTELMLVLILIFNNNATKQQYPLNVIQVIMLTLQLQAQLQTKQTNNKKIK